jgi:hypothetical protein
VAEEIKKSKIKVVAMKKDFEKHQTGLSKTHWPRKLSWLLVFVAAVAVAGFLYLRGMPAISGNPNAIYVYGAPV